MTTADGSPRGALGEKTFLFQGETITAEKANSSWTLSLGKRVIETRDLPRGIDSLLGKSLKNHRLVVLILEWQAGAD
jgi:hypothetical protein